jgi:hypothetical protein
MSRHGVEENVFQGCGRRCCWQSSLPVSYWSCVRYYWRAQGMGNQVEGNRYDEKQINDTKAKLTLFSNRTDRHIQRRRDEKGHNGERAVGASEHANCIVYDAYFFGCPRRIGGGTAIFRDRNYSVGKWSRDSLYTHCLKYIQFHQCCLCSYSSSSSLRLSLGKLIH